MTFRIDRDDESQRPLIISDDERPAYLPRRFTNCRTCGVPLTGIPERRAAGFCSTMCGHEFYGTTPADYDY